MFARPAYVHNASLPKLNQFIAELEMERNRYPAGLVLSLLSAAVGLSYFIYSSYTMATSDDAAFVFDTRNIRDTGGNFSTETGVSCHDLFPYHYDDPCKLNLNEVNFTYDFMVFCAKLLDESCKSFVKAERSEPSIAAGVYAGICIIIAIVTPPAYGVLGYAKTVNDLSYSQQTLLNNLANDLNITFDNDRLSSIIKALKIKRDEMTHPVQSLDEELALLPDLRR